MSAWQTIGKQRICVTDDLIEIEIGGEFLPAELLSGLALVEETQGASAIPSCWSSPAPGRFQPPPGKH